MPVLCNKLQKKVGKMFGRLVTSTIFDASNHKQNPHIMNTQETFYCFRVEEFNGTYCPTTEIFELTKDEFMNHIDTHPYWDENEQQFEQPLLWGYDDYSTAYNIYTEAKLNAEFWYAN